MGVLSTYGELKTGVSDYTGRGGNTTFVTNLPIFVRRAHDTLMRELRIPLLQTTADFSITGERVAVPSGFRAVGRLYIDSDFDTPLSPTSVENRMRTASLYTSAKPAVFAIEGSYLAFGPVPDATYTGKLLYYRSLDFFASDVATNDLLTRYPFAYFYGALAEAARFDRDEEATASFEAMFQAELRAIDSAERRDAMLGGALAPMPSGGATP